MTITKEQKEIRAIFNTLIQKYMDEANDQIDKMYAADPACDPTGNAACAIIENAEDNAWAEATRIYKEEETMKATTNMKKVNVEVKNNKEEKKMTKDRIVSKNTSVNTEVEPKSQGMFSMFEEVQAELEKENEGVSFGTAAQSKGALAQYENLGLRNMVIESIKMVPYKKEGNEDTGEAPQFSMKLEIKFDACEQNKATISMNYFLFRNEKMVKLPIYHAITNASGDTGMYFTVKTKSLNKKAEELTAEDLDAHKIMPNERIWAPAKKEFKELNNIFGVSEISFDADGKADIPRGIEVPVYVYEDVVVTEKTTMDENKKVHKEEVTDFFYNVSFIPPEKQLKAGKVEKYGKRFTTSKNINRVKDIQSLPGVIAYREALLNA